MAFGLAWPWTRGPGSATGVEAVRAWIRNLLLTPAYSVKMAPQLGSALPNVVFENTGPALSAMVESEVRRLISQYVPEVDSVSVEVTSEETGNGTRLSVELVVQVGPDVFHEVFSVP